MPSLNYSSWYQSLNDWFLTPAGIVASNEFSKVIQNFEHLFKGDVLIQIGGGGANAWLDLFHYNHQWIATPISLSSSNEIRCHLNHIPLDRNTADCVLLPLSLEPFKHSEYLLDEVDRILKPMGFMVLFCINPWSLWGAAIKLGTLRCYNKQKITMHSPYGINRMMLARGYRQCALTHFCYLPPVNNSSMLRKLGFLNEVGKMLWPFPSGLYCMIFQKYEHISPNLLVAPLMTELPEPLLTMPAN